MELFSSDCKAANHILLSFSPVAVAILEGDRNIIRNANYNFCQLMGTSDDLIIGENYAHVALDKGSLVALERANPASIGKLPRAPEISYYRSESHSYIIIPVPATADHAHGALMLVSDTKSPDELMLAMNEALIISAIREHEQRKTAEMLLRRLETETTERRRAEAALEEGRRLEAIGQLAGQIAHDFNNLLTIILMNTSMARHSHDADLNELLVTIEDSAKRGAQFTKSLLAVARQQPLSPEPVDLTLQCAELQSLVAATCGPQISIVVEVPSEPIWVNIDIGGLSRSILNIGINSRDAMLDGGTLKLHLKTQNVPDPIHQTPLPLVVGSYAVIEISDTGTGMSPEVMQKCFEPFFSTKGKLGLGLGLATVAEFATRSGGCSEISSEPGVGTTVRFYLPICRPPVCLNKIETRAARSEDSYRVLLVDDEANIRNALEATLKQAGYQVTSVSSASMALVQLGNNTFDIMVSDIVMPGMDGVTLARQAASSYPALAIILMTGFGMRPLEEILPWKIIDKPFDRDELLAALTEIRTAPLK